MGVADRRGLRNIVVFSCVKAKFLEERAVEEETGSQLMHLMKSTVAAVK